MSHSWKPQPLSDDPPFKGPFAIIANGNGPCGLAMRERSTLRKALSDWDDADGNAYVLDCGTGRLVNMQSTDVERFITDEHRKGIKEINK